MILRLILGSAVAYVFWSLVCLEINVRKARKIPVPYMRLPVDGNNIPWQVFSPFIWSVLDRLPIPWSSYPDFVRYSRRGWHFKEGPDSQVRMGPVWALVSPACIDIHFSDPEAVTEIYRRRNDFVRPIKEYKLLEVYGPCISTAGWDDWSRHRKVLAAPFNENIMNFVWEESLRQASSMVRSWHELSETGIPSTQTDTRTFSLNVLAAAGFRKSYDFRSSAEPVVDEGSYRHSLQTVLDNIIPLMMIPYEFLTKPMIPKGLAKIGNAAISFKKYMLKMLKDETEALNQGKPGSGSLMTGFVRAMDTHSQESSPSNSNTRAKKIGLSVDEILGNLFVINFAGHDTTANTLAFTMFFLAAYPEVQTWLSEEITALTRNKPTNEWDYQEIFPQLKRCRAVLYETLRHAPPIMSIPKWTAQKQQTINVRGKTLVIPPETATLLFVRGSHSSSENWPDPDSWKPSRWIVNPAPTHNPSMEQILSEELFVPKPGTYFPFSDGPQNCLGRKFATVEAVAVFACLFESHRLSVKKNVEESDEASRQRALDCTQDVDMEMLLRLANSDQVTLVCKEVSATQS